MIADLLEGRPVVQASLFPVEAVRKVIDIKSMIKEFQIEGGILSLRSNSGIDKVSISDCHWQRVDPDDLDKIAQPLVGENPPGGYFCKVDVFVTQNYGIKAKAMTEGYFFKDANQKWMYLGKDAHGFERY